MDIEYNYQSIVASTGHPGLDVESAIVEPELQWWQMQTDIYIPTVKSQSGLKRACQRQERLMCRYMAKEDVI
jgi:hypothetical protein